MSGILLTSIGTTFAAPFGPPVNTVAPVLSKSNTYSNTHRVSTGTWTGTPGFTYTYQWQVDGVDVAGETTNQYDAFESDINKFISCKVTATNAQGATTVSTNSVFISGNDEVRFTTPGTYTWVVPSGVSSIAVVCVGAGGSGGGRGPGGAGGALAYRNYVAVSAGQSYTIVVGAPGSTPSYAQYSTAGGDSSAFGCVAGGGQASGPKPIPAGAPGGVRSGTTSGGGSGGNGGPMNATSTAISSGGGGAGGYGGDGGIGAAYGAAESWGAGTNGAGAGGRYASNSTSGGGVGLGGRGDSGTTSGQGGSGGSNGGGSGGLYGGGGRGNNNSNSGRLGGGGAVRIIWPSSSTTRRFPTLAGYL